MDLLSGRSFSTSEKAFDLIDRRILVNKLCNLQLLSVINWIIDFLSSCFQKTKLVDGCYSEWASVPSGVLQGIKLGPWLFIIMINDLALSDTCVWKYVADTTTSVVVPKGETTGAQLMCPGLHYNEALLTRMNLVSLKEHMIVIYAMPLLMTFLMTTES